MSKAEKALRVMSAPAPSPKDPAAVRSVFIGDSLTHAGDWSRLLGWTAVRNYGVPGDTTRALLARLHLCLDRKAERYFVMGGINDIALDFDTGEAAANLLTLVARLRDHSPSADIYLQSALPIDHTLWHLPSAPERILELNRQLRNAHRPDAGVWFINLHAGFRDETGKLNAEYTTDGVHLSPAGYRRWAELLTGFLSSRRDSPIPPDGRR